MSTDYILFIHGVNVRNKTAYISQTNQMFEKIKASLKDSNRSFKPIILYWGNVGGTSTNNLLNGLQSSSKWKEFWFQDLRSTQILPFVGDAALYLSRSVSRGIVEQITSQAIEGIGLTLKQLENPPKGDRLHLVTHSWGTVILFDILFSSRWEDPHPFVSDNTRKLIENIRHAFFGIGRGEEKNYGLPLASIHTMGSPIALFNLVNINDRSSFDLTPKLKEFLEVLQKEMRKPLPWRNYAHPGDPIAYPLEGVMPLFLDQAQNLVEIKDVMSPTGIGGVFGKTNIPIINLLPLINGGTAHGSYWTEPKVAQQIGNVIRQTQN